MDKSKQVNLFQVRKAEFAKLNALLKKTKKNESGKPMKAYLDKKVEPAKGIEAHSAYQNSLYQ